MVVESFMSHFIAACVCVQVKAGKGRSDTMSHAIDTLKSKKKEEMDHVTAIGITVSITLDFISRASPWVIC